MVDVNGNSIVHMNKNLHESKVKTNDNSSGHPSIADGDVVPIDKDHHSPNEDPPKGCVVVDALHGTDLAAEGMKKAVALSKDLVGNVMDVLPMSVYYVVASKVLAAMLNMLKKV